MCREVVALELERRRQQRVLDGPWLERQPHRARLRVVREAARECPDASEHGVSCDFAGETFGCSRVQVQLRGEVLPSWPIQDHDAGNEWPVVAEGISLLE